MYFENRRHIGSMLVVVTSLGLVNNSHITESNDPCDTLRNTIAALGRRPADPLKTPALGVPESASLADPAPPSRSP